MKKIEDLLLRSMSEKLSSEERAQLSAALAKSAELREEQANLRQMHDLLEQQRYSFGTFFPAKIRHAIESRLESWETPLLKRFPQLAFASLAAIILLLVGMYLAEGSISIETISGIESVAPEELVAYSW